MKLTLFLMYMLALILGGNVWAQTADSQAVDNDLQSAQESNSMIWPMLPGESLNEVARLFYPKNVVMQRLFVRKTLQNNIEKHPHLNAASRFSEPTLLVVPALKSLSKQMQPKQATPRKPRLSRLQITTDFESLLNKVPVKFKEEYEFWVSKNELLKQQLAILKQKIVFLETKLNSLTLVWEKTLSQPAGENVAINADNKPNTSLSTDIAATANHANIATTVATNKAIGANNVAAVTSVLNSANADSVANASTSKKVFKNLNQQSAANATATMIEPAQASNNLLNYLNSDLAKIALALGMLVVLAAFFTKKIS